MATLETVAETHPSGSLKRIVNDMSIQVATVNGSGSQTANTILLRAIFQMGIPVSGKTSFRPTSPVFRPGTPFGRTATDTSRGRRKLISWWR